MSDDTTDHVAQIIEGLEPGAFVTKFVLVAEVIDTDGVQCVWTHTHDDASAWDTLGLLGYATAIEEANLHNRGGDE